MMMILVFIQLFGHGLACYLELSFGYLYHSCSKPGRPPTKKLSERKSYMRPRHSVNTIPLELPGIYITYFFLCYFI